MATPQPTNGHGLHPEPGLQEATVPPAAEPETPKAAEPATVPEPPKEKKAHMGFGPMGVQLTSLAELWRFAEIIFRSGMVPKALDSVEKVVIALQFGAEFGVAAMASVRSVVIINNTPSWKGDMALALVQSSGKLSHYKKWYEGEGKTRKALVLTQRTNQTEPFITEFSYNDAVLAKLWGKTGRDGQDTPWITYPDRMLHYRALGFNLRDNFPDVMMGTTTAEELADIPVHDITPISATTTRPALAAAPPPDPLLSMISKRKVAPPAEAITGKSGPPLEERFVLVDPAAPADPDLTGALKASLEQRQPKKKRAAAPKPAPVNDCTHPDIKPSDIPAGEVRRCPRCTEELHRDPLPPQIA